MLKERINRLAKALKKHKKRAVIIAAAVIAVGAAGSILLVKNHRNKTGALEETIAETTAVTGTISDTIEGDGNLEAADAVSVLLPEGVEVATWYVEEGDEVSKGDKLAKLDTGSITSVLATIDSQLEEVEDALDDSDLTDNETANLTNQQNELESMQKTLTKYAKKPVVKATADGVIASISTSSGTTEEDSSEQGGKSTASADTDTGSAVTAASVSTASSETQVSSTGTANGFVLLADVSLSDADTTITDFSGLTVTAPVTGAAPQTAISSTGTFTGTIEWSPSDASYAAETVYTATIRLTPADGYCFSAASLPQIAGAQVNGSVNEATGVMTLTVTYPATEAASDKPNDGSSDSGSSSRTSGTSGAGGSSGASGKSASAKSSGSKQTSSSGKSASGAASGGSASGSASGGSSGGSSATSTSAGSSSGIDILSETELCTIETADSMQVSINVDELDITSVEEGQEATVTVEALDQSFTGSVSHISYEPVSSSSTVKYEVVITVEGSEDMRIGMSASASIVLSSAENVVTLSMSALQQEGDEMFVYTEKDSNGNLSGKVTVKTGLSDGSVVEITEGLSDGDTVYYTRSSGSDNESNRQSGFDMGGMGGQMPGGGGSGGGEPPSGGGGMGGPPSN